MTNELTGKIVVTTREVFDENDQVIKKSQDDIIPAERLEAKSHDGDGSYTQVLFEAETDDGANTVEVTVTYDQHGNLEGIETELTSGDGEVSTVDIKESKPVTED